MDYQDSNKRLKAANGTPVAVTNTYEDQPSAPVASVGGRLGSGSTAKPSASVDRLSTGTKPGLRLTVKAPPSKLRQATSSSQQSLIPPNPYIDGLSDSDATPAPASRTARSTRNPRAVIEPDSEDNDEDAEAEDEDMEDVDQEILANEDDEDEDDDAEGEDEEMDDHPPPPIIKQFITQTGRPDVKVTAPPTSGPLKSVEAKELDDEDDDEELSELEEADENEIEEVEADELGEDEDLDASGEEDDDLSRSGTPDLTKLTRRQRGRYEEEGDASLMALSNEALKKKHLTAEEHAMRRAEMARRRKNLSDKKNEEEKLETINKLLKKPAPKRRTRAEIIAAQHADFTNGGTPGTEDGEFFDHHQRPDPGYTRYVQDRLGARLGVPEEWIGTPVGRLFGGAGGNGGRKMVEEVG
ncbi:hypothetical protein LTR62_004866 [Meristemomyces frigidus]|uniref:INO80 complex subunit B-like conserved region domain-containing protein n=1 Tax=Meristemomyces frigidus TaxID=1508187 RepID=A0AAN7YFU5_9PEZI|nr:hypothetical protein LTR62_004866 [Meristemomyces frigidus]